MDSQTVAITGAAGLLGTWLRRRVPSDTDVVSVTHRRRVDDGPERMVDLRDSAAVVTAFEEIGPSLIVHAAYARDEGSIVAATTNVVEAARRVGAELLFISSEAVFSGDGVPRAEEDPPDPVWDYGRWKVQAERAVSSAAGCPAIVRLPLVISLDPEDHVVTDIRAGAASGTPSVWFDDEMRAPAYADELASAIWRTAGLAPEDRAGVWHLSGAERLSRYEIARRAIAILGLDPGVIAPASTPAGARRPRDLRLTDDRARRQIGWDPTPVLARPTR